MTQRTPFTAEQLAQFRAEHATVLERISVHGYDLGRPYVRGGTTMLPFHRTLPVDDVEIPSGDLDGWADELDMLARPAPALPAPPVRRRTKR